MKPVILVLLLFTFGQTNAQSKTKPPESHAISIISDSDESGKSRSRSESRNGETFSSFDCRDVTQDGFFDVHVHKGMLLFTCEAVPFSGEINIQPVSGNRSLTHSQFTFQKNQTDRCLTYAIWLIPGEYQYQVKLNNHLQTPVRITVKASEKQTITLLP